MNRRSFMKTAAGTAALVAVAPVSTLAQLGNGSRQPGVATLPNRVFCQTIAVVELAPNLKFFVDASHDNERIHVRQLRFDSISNAINSNIFVKAIKLDWSKAPSPKVVEYKMIADPNGGFGIVNKVTLDGFPAHEIIMTSREGASTALLIAYDDKNGRWLCDRKDKALDQSAEWINKEFMGPEFEGRIHPYQCGMSFSAYEPLNVPRQDNAIGDIIWWVTRPLYTGAHQLYNGSCCIAMSDVFGEMIMTA